jgi:hypothetical protein
LNSVAVIQRLFSTSIRRAHANAPPKLDIETPAKVRNNTAIEGRRAAATATTTGASSSVVEARGWVKSDSGMADG